MKAAKKKLKFSTVSKKGTLKNVKKKFLTTKPPILKKEPKITIKSKNNLKLKKKAKEEKSVKKRAKSTKKTTKKKLKKDGVKKGTKKKTVKKMTKKKKVTKKKVSKKNKTVDKLKVKRGSYIHRRLNTLGKEIFYFICSNQ